MAFKIQMSKPFGIQTKWWPFWILYIGSVLECVIRTFPWSITLSMYWEGPFQNPSILNLNVKMFRFWMFGNWASTLLPKIDNVLNLAIFWLDFELWGKDRPCDGLRCDFKFEQPNTFDVQLDENETVIRLVHFLQIFRHFAQRCLLDSAFHSTGVFGIWKNKQIIQWESARCNGSDGRAAAS